MLIFGADLEQVKVIKTLLSSKFDMKDIGEADHPRDKNNVMLFQSHYCRVPFFAMKIVFTKDVIFI